MMNRSTSLAYNSSLLETDKTEHLTFVEERMLNCLVHNEAALICSVNQCYENTSTHFHKG